MNENLALAHGDCDAGFNRNKGVYKLRPPFRDFCLYDIFSSFFFSLLHITHSGLQNNETLFSVMLVLHMTNQNCDTYIFTLMMWD